MGMQNNERAPHVTNIYLGSQLSTANLIVPGIYFRKHSRIKGVNIINGAALSKDNTNHVTFTLQDNSSSPVAYAAFDTSSAAFVAQTPVAMTLSTPVGDTTNQPEADVPAGTTLGMLVVGHGTGITTLAVACVEWYPL